MFLQVAAHASALALAMTLVPAGWVHVLARTVRVGHVVCDHPEPYVYCALTGDGLFELWLARDQLGGMCPVAPPTRTLRYPYRVRPMIQWVTGTVGRPLCLSASVSRAARPEEPLTSKSTLVALSMETHGCIRSGTDHVELTPLDEINVAGDGPLVLQVTQQSPTGPVDILAVYVYVQVIYE